MATLSEDDIVRIAKEEGVPPEYALAIMRKENSGDSDVSSAGAKGRFQLLPTTFKSVHPDGNIDNPIDNAKAGIRYLKQGLEKNDGDFKKAAAYYYAGPEWESKVKRTPKKKYGTNPDGTAGISIEDYATQAAQFANVSSGQDSSSAAGGTKFGDLDAQLATLGMQADKQLEQVGNASVSLSERIRANIEKQVSSVRKGGELAATVELDKFRQTTAKAGEHAATLTRLGINTSDTDSIVAEISTQLTQDFAQAQELRAAIDEKRSVGLFDNPIEYLVNQFTIKGDIRAHNAIIRRMKSQKQFVDQATGIASAVQQVNSAKFVPISMEGAKASAEILRNKAEADALKIEDQLLKTDFDTQVRTLNVIQSRITNIQGMMAAEDRRGARADRAAADAAKAEAMKLDDQGLQVAGRILGLEVSGRKDVDKMPKDMQAAIEYVKANGGQIGKDPLEAWEMLARGNPDRMPPAIRYQRDILDAAKRQAEATVRGNKVLAAAPVKQRVEALREEMSKVLENAARNPNVSIRPSSDGTVDNPYHIPTHNVMKALPEVRGLPITKVIDNHIKNFPNKPVHDAYILELAYENVGEGKVYRDITEAARDVATYYRYGAQFNNQKMKFPGFGMVQQTEYKVGKIDYLRYDQLVKYYLEKKRREFNHPDFGRFSGPGEQFKTVEQKLLASEEGTPKDRLQNVKVGGDQ
jgi:hypothetical protein